MFNMSKRTEYYEQESVLPPNDSSVLMPVTTAVGLLNTQKNGLGSSIVIRAVCGCLNRNVESRILFGIKDTRAVAGILLDRVQRDEARLAWDQITSEKIFPRITHKYAAIYFVPVVTFNTLKRLDDTFVVEIYLKPLKDVLYSLRDGGRCILRDEDSEFELSSENVRLLGIRRKMKAYSGTIHGLLADIAKLKNNNEENGF
uniref:Schlafen AlbA-2 domain-containing protein n=1 Tax=Strigamia maritima TaxID=126957 RepID=T1JLL5_STRMM